MGEYNRSMARQETKHKTSVWCYHYHLTRGVTDSHPSVGPAAELGNTPTFYLLSVPFVSVCPYSCCLSVMLSCLSISPSVSLSTCVCLYVWQAVCHPPGDRCRSSSRTSSRSPGHRTGTRWCQSDTWTWRSLSILNHSGEFMLYSRLSVWMYSPWSSPGGM